MSEESEKKPYYWRTTRSVTIHSTDGGVHAVPMGAYLEEDNLEHQMELGPGWMAVKIADTGGAVLEAHMQDVGENPPSEFCRNCGEEIIQSEWEDCEIIWDHLDDRVRCTFPRPKNTGFYDEDRIGNLPTGTIRMLQQLTVLDAATETIRSSIVVWGCGSWSMVQITDFNSRHTTHHFWETMHNHEACAMAWAAKRAGWRDLTSPAWINREPDFSGGMEPWA